MHRQDTEQLNETWLPGGEVTFALDPAVADGRLVVERILVDGQAIGPVELTWSGGQLQSMESPADLFRLRSYLSPDELRRGRTRLHVSERPPGM